MKKILCLVLVLSMVLSTALSFASCGNKKPFDMTPFEEFEEAEGVVYTGVFGTEKTTVKIANGMGSVIRTTTQVVTSNVYCTYTDRIVIASAVINNGVLTLSGKSNVTYRRTECSGSGAEEYKSQWKAYYEEQIASKKFSEEDYDQAIAELNGEEVLYSISNPNLSGTEYEIEIRLNEEEKTCEVVKCNSSFFIKPNTSSATSEYIPKFGDILSLVTYPYEEYEYTSDGGLTKSLVIYQIYDLLDTAGQYRALSCTYFDNGMMEIEHYFVEEKNGRFDIRERYAFSEYREGGTIERITVWYKDEFSGRPDIVIENEPSFYSSHDKIIYEFDENDNLISAKGYDEQEKLTEYNEIEYNENGNRTDTHYMLDEQGNFVIRDSTSYEYDEKGNVKTKTKYDADGNITYTVEYDKDGNKINE